MLTTRVDTGERTGDGGRSQVCSVVVSGKGRHVATSAWRNRVGRRPQLAAVVLVATWMHGGSRAVEPAAARRLTAAEAERAVADDRALVVGLADVRELDADVAAVLARCRTVLELSGLTDLSPDVAAALARCPGAVDLSGLRSLSPEAARALAAYRGPRARRERRRRRRAAMVSRSGAETGSRTWAVRPAVDRLFSVGPRLV